MRFVRIIMVIMLANVSAFAQEVSKGEHFIEVSGNAEMEVEPNEIFLIIRLKEFEDNRNKVLLEKLDQDFLASLKAAGVDKKNLTLADAGSALSKLGRREKDAFREKTYELKLTSAAELEKFLEKIEPVKVDRLDLTKLSHSDIKKFKLELKVKALQAAQGKAQTLLKSIGSDIGKPLMVREWESDPVYPMAQQGNVMYRMAEADNASGQETSFRKLKLTAQITAQFEIK
jgi:uncharacterized protein